eukprot:TRINITY_DN25125_c0_g1_i1.p1 TRINITY_DN25125_c0_g1~~TRINITY_DN25125_c0_g1_i1.p1  ORF type:complete len:222 (-),score=1.87 TRINITY_DN25125_c0_g1_i1:48-713(-)
MEGQQTCITVEQNLPTSRTERSDFVRSLSPLLWLMSSFHSRRVKSSRRPICTIAISCVSGGTALWFVDSDLDYVVPRLAAYPKGSIVIRFGDMPEHMEIFSMPPPTNIFYRRLNDWKRIQQFVEAVQKVVDAGGMAAIVDEFDAGLCTQSLPGVTLYQCGGCDELTAKKKRFCGGCRSVVYCNAECQAGHWAQHKQVCSGIRRGLLDPLDVLPSQTACATF